VGISLLDLMLDIFLALSEFSVFFGRLVSEDFDLILQDLDSFLHFGQILGGVLDLRNILIPGVLDLFIEGNEST